MREDMGTMVASAAVAVRKHARHQAKDRGCSTRTNATTGMVTPASACAARANAPEQTLGR